MIVTAHSIWNASGMKGDAEAGDGCTVGRSIGVRERIGFAQAHQALLVALEKAGRFA
jgi:hypothetical protein